MENNIFKIPILLRLMEKQATEVNTLLNLYGLKIKEMNYNKDINFVPNKWFTLEVLK
jgi:hypothetical protein